jgi:hypothetical protein
VRASFWACARCLTCVAEPSRTVPLALHRRSDVLYQIREREYVALFLRRRCYRAVRQCSIVDRCDKQ